MRRPGVLLAAAVILAVVASPSMTWTAEAAKAPAFSVTVSPVRLELAADPGGSIVTSVTVTNASSDPVSLTAEYVDFTSQGEEGKPKLVPAGTMPGSMSGWILAEPASFEVKPGETMKVSVSIKVPKTAEPGGHYAAVLFASAPEPGGQTAVVAKVGALMLLSVSGKVREAGSLSLLGEQLFESGPVTISALFSNGGNVHVKPTGSIAISRLWGGEAAKLVVGGENVLPSGARRFDAKWNDPPMGVYVARAAMKYGTAGRTATSAQRYIVVFPWKLGLAGLGLFVLGLVSSRLLRRKKA